jgi:2-isopropylmalate synthase
MSDTRRIKIFDTTLRDGEQSPGCSMNLREKMEVAQALVELGVDIIEAGFPIASPGDFESVREIAGAVRGATICGLARCNSADIDRAWEALKLAPDPRIHVFLATSAIHREFKLKMTREEIVERAVAGVKRAVSYCDDVEFSPEDAARTERDFLCQVVEAAIASGATTVNIPDTVGYATPQDYGSVIALLKNRVPNIDKAVISTHCHNDLGLAVANSLAAVENGAGQIECTINGIGERAGNTSLEEVVMALRTRKNYLDLDTGITTEQIYPTSRLVSQVTGIPVPINKPIVGDNAFAHEAGIHQDGVLKHKQTYEIMTPESVGITGNRLVMGKHSGRHAFDERLKHLGFNLSKEDMNRAFLRFKELADKKKNVYDEDIEAIIGEEILRVPGQPDRYELLYLNVNSSSDGIPAATIKMRVNGQEKMDYASGDGAVDACYKVITKITGSQSQLVRYNVSALTGGADAQGEVSCIIEDGGFRVSGQGAHTDIIMASALAYINALNKLEGRKHYRQLVEREGP